MARTNKPLSKAAQKRRKDIDNAKRRYRRQADRYRSEASKLGGRDAEILNSAANRLEEFASALNGINVRKPSNITDEQKKLIKESKDYLVTNMRDDWQRGETLGKLRLSGTVEGHKFFALTESLWEGVDYEDRFDAIRKQISKNPDIVARYGKHPNVNEMIEIIADATGIAIDEESLQMGSDSVEMMSGIRSVIVNYG